MPLLTRAIRGAAGFFAGLIRTSRVFIFFADVTAMGVRRSRSDSNLRTSTSTQSAHIEHLYDSHRQIVSRLIN